MSAEKEESGLSFTHFAEHTQRIVEFNRALLLSIERLENLNERALGSCPSQEQVKASSMGEAESAVDQQRGALEKLEELGTRLSDALDRAESIV